MKKSGLTRRNFLSGSASVALGLLLGRLSGASAQGAAASKFPSDMELALDFTLTPPSGGRWNRPYLAVWFEDGAGRPVRTLSLWVQASGRGLRYVDHLTRWTQDTGGDMGLIQTVSSPTRNPGQYSLSWDGKNDKGQPVALGDYYLCIEYAREHGPYDLIREKVTLGRVPFKKALPGNPEVGGVSLEYRKKA